ncbi:D-methionine transport system permease protein MetI [bioreactor metagenome]|jgi:D-methionine transport system permease protein|uniref:D-methionine transport system permease protein MetI n=1 Tax=bioreactor metagenome TaxID=1076179 RepID=A0A644VW84_9ZZZZ|nr:methionine ABC transporter permease [Acidaminococcaceae bacterium]
MSHEMIELLLKALWETCYMVAASTVLATLVGMPLGIILTITSKGHILENKSINAILGAIVNATRSTPFIILMVAIIPLTRMIVGSSIGTTAAIVPLTISAAPFIARIIESSLLEIDPGVIEASQSMGASPMQIINKVLLPEAMHSIVLGVTLAIISLIGYSAMAGALGGGGLGDLAIRYGYQRFRMDIMIATVVILIAQVQIVQSLGNYISSKLNKTKI